jgi:hypothetical protein
MTNATALWIVAALLLALLLPGRGPSPLREAPAVSAGAGIVRHPATFNDKEGPGRVREAPGSVREAPGAARHPTTTRDNPRHPRTNFGPARQAGPTTYPADP